jgi:hypothetical protein
LLLDVVENFLSDSKHFFLLRFSRGLVKKARKLMPSGKKVPKNPNPEN